MSKLIDEWHDISYPVVFQDKIGWWIWKHLFCPSGWHLFDESMSEEDHCLYCDACGLTVYIDHIIEEEEDVRQYREFNDH